MAGVIFRMSGGNVLVGMTTEKVVISDDHCQITVALADIVSCCQAYTSGEGTQYGKWDTMPDGNYTLDSCSEDNCFWKYVGSWGDTNWTDDADTSDCSDTECSRQGRFIIEAERIGETWRVRAFCQIDPDDTGTGGGTDCGTLSSDFADIVLTVVMTQASCIATSIVADTETCNTLSSHAVDCTYSPAPSAGFRSGYDGTAKVTP